MLSDCENANQIAGLLNQPFLQNKLMKQPIFLYVDTNSQKLKVDRKIFSWIWSKMAVVNLVSGLLNSLYLKNALIELTGFSMLVQIDANQKVLGNFWYGNY